MTTVAWSRAHGVIAADKQSSYHCNPTIKLFRLPDESVVGISGISDCMHEAVEFLNGAIDKPSLADDAGTLLRVYPDGRAVMYHNRLVAIPVLLDFMAIGSGGDYAMGAMAMGASPAEAVAIAHRFDPNTGPEIDTIEIA